MNYLPISFRVAALALGQSYDCPSASEATLKDMGQISGMQPQEIISVNYVRNSWVVPYNKLTDGVKTRRNHFTHWNQTLQQWLKA